MVALVVDAVLSLHNIREVATSVQWVSHTSLVWETHWTLVATSRML